MHVRTGRPADRLGVIIFLLGATAALLARADDFSGVASETPASRQAQERGDGRDVYPSDGPTASQTSTPEARTFYSRYRRFGLPITVLQAPYQIRTVQLHVSTDGGSTWRTYAEEPATRQEFVFQAPQDGDYWFASKTVDIQNSVRPTGPTRAEQHVVIDTEKPQFELRADVTAHGTVRITWRIADRNLDPKSFLLEYQVPPRDDWAPVALPPELLTAERGVMSGEFEWKPDVSSRMVFLGSRVKDKAGNVAAESTRIFLPRVAARPGPAKLPDESRAELRAESRAEPQAKAIAEQNALPPRSAPRSEQGWASVEREETSRGFSGSPTADDYDPGGSPQEAKPGDDWSIAESQKASSGPGQLATKRTEWPEESESGRGVAGDVRPQVAAQIPARDAASENPSSADTTPETDFSSARTAWPEIPAGESLRMTRSYRFYLEYDIEAAGPEGVAEVELWATQDGGRSWEKWGVDADKQSPLDVQVDEEGIYGFRIVVVGKNGLAAPTPQSGDPADLWVGVDTTAPKAEITAVVYGTGARSGELDIRWIAEDRRLTARPITLSFSDTRAGPWTTIATGLPNSGQYFWKLDGSVPKQVFLRIECRDEAGNATEFIIREPVNTVGLSPKGRIRGFRPAEGDAETGKSAWRWFPWR